MAKESSIVEGAADRYRREIEHYFDENKSFFTNVPLKASFLIGLYTACLLDVQRAMGKGETPFMKELGALELDEVKVKSLFPQVKQKLYEYEREYRLDEIVADYLVQAGHGWKLSADEIRLVFTMGISLKRRLIVTD